MSMIVGLGQAPGAYPPYGAMYAQGDPGVLEPYVNYTNQPTPPVFNFQPGGQTNWPVAPLQNIPTDPSGNMYSSSPYGQMVNHAGRRNRKAMRHQRRQALLDARRRAGVLHGLGNIEILDADMDGYGASVEIMDGDFLGEVLGDVSPTTRKFIGIAAIAGAVIGAVLVTRKIAKGR